MRRMFSEKQIREMAKAISEKAIENDKDIISKIVVEYNEDGNYTSIIFPKGIIPLSITLNTHTLFFCDEKIVNYNREEVEGYELDDLYIDEDKVNLDILGDISEQVINELIYVNSDGNMYNLIDNSYYLFYPEKLGTKLYYHEIELDYDGDVVYISFISNSDSHTTDAVLKNIFNNIDDKCVFNLKIVSNDLDIPYPALILMTKWDSVDGYQLVTYSYSDNSIVSKSAPASIEHESVTAL